MEKLDELIKEHTDKIKVKAEITKILVAMTSVIAIALGFFFIFLPLWILTEIINNVIGWF